MEKYNIPRRKGGKIKYILDKPLLEKLYINQRLSSLEIAKRLGIKSYITVLNNLKKYGITRRTISEAFTKYPKKSFSGNLNEKSYLLGLRAGDIYARRNHNLIRVSTTTTHLSQVRMFNNVFSRYSHPKVYVFTHPKWGEQWRLECDLDKSFDFLLEKPTKIPKSIIENKNAFYNFLAGYMDCEGSWFVLKTNKNNIRFTFRLMTTDKIILLQLKNRLKKLGYKSIFRLEKTKDTKTSRGISKKDLFALYLLQKKDVNLLATKLLPLSYHYEKIRKMKLILGIKHNKWDRIQDKLLSLRREINKEKIGEIDIKHIKW